MKHLIALAAVALTATPALAEIRWCPIDRAYYDTETGLIVSRPERRPRTQRCRKEKTSYGWNYDCD